METTYQISRSYEWSVTANIEKINDGQFKATINRKEIEGMWDDETEEVLVTIKDGEYSFDGSLSNQEEWFIKQSIAKYIESNGNCLGNHYLHTPAASLREIKITWTTDDVFMKAQEMGIDITEEQAEEVLEKMERYHDASIGISWDVIASYLSDLK